jgi:hypothetical protein
LSAIKAFSRFSQTLDSMADLALTRILEKAVTAHFLDAGMPHVAIRVIQPAAGQPAVYAISVSPDARWCFERLFQRVFCRQPIRRHFEYLLEEREVTELAQREPYYSALPALACRPLGAHTGREPLG